MEEKKEESINYKYLEETCKLNNVKYKQVKEFKKSLSTEEIVKRLGGGDNTAGSCSSLALAYIGNRGGFDVLDFRGGNSRKIFVSKLNIARLAKLKDVISFEERNTNDFSALKNLIKNVKKGKEYYLATGGHAAIIKEIDKGLEYLELQSLETQGYPMNGFTPFRKATLKDRFGCQKSHTFCGQKIEPLNILIDGESLSKNKEFKKLMGYINTDKDAQMKGDKGDVK